MRRKIAAVTSSRATTATCIGRCASLRHTRGGSEDHRAGVPSLSRIRLHSKRDREKTGSRLRPGSNAPQFGQRCRHGQDDRCGNSRLADCLGRCARLVNADLQTLRDARARVVATALRIPLVHIEGGEISEGVIDDAIRNALTKLSHIHFTSTGVGASTRRRHGRGGLARSSRRRSFTRPLAPQPAMSREQVEARLDIISRALLP